MRESRFRAMGTDCHVVVVDGDASLVDRAEAQVRGLEARWSRFIDTSELSRLNAAAGGPVILPDDTFELIALAVKAWQVSGGRFDPTVLDAVEAAGYDRTFDDIRGRDLVPGPDADPGAAPAPGCEGIVLDRRLHAVTLPVGCRLDLGGIGKGRAADMVARAMVDQGARGAMVNLGGDLRAIGSPPEGTAWVVAIEDPMAPPAEVARVAITDGAVATSTRSKRAWTVEGRPAHHLIDPATGQPGGSDLVAVTVLASSAAWAEVMAKAVFLAGVDAGRAMLAAAGVTGLGVDLSGTMVAFDGLEPFLAQEGAA